MARSARSLSDVGESALIERIARRAGRAPPRDWTLGIGDDAAVLRPRPGEEIVLSTDALVERVHFRLDRETPRAVGRRALIVNLSDLAAMGARPAGCLLSMALPRSLPLAIFDALVAGLVDETRRHACPLVGGNLSAADACSLTVTVVGRIERGRALRRGGVRAGDRLFVSGVLGAGALARLRADARGTRLRRVPTPRLAAGRVLARMPWTRGCLDLSDGLVTDLAHLLEGTGLGAEIDPEALPRPPGFERACRQLGVDPLTLLTTGGEDYELLFALGERRKSGARRAPPRGAQLSAKLGLPVHEIGRVVARSGLRGLPARAVAHHF